MDRKDIETAKLLRPFILNLLPPRKKGVFWTKILGGFLLGVAVFTVAYVISVKVLNYFLSFQLIGPFLTAKVLQLILLTFFALLIFSNLITSLGTFFLASDLQLLAATPISKDSLFVTRFSVSVMISSWMVFIFGLPIFLAYGHIYHAGVEYYLLLPILLLPFLIIPASIGKLITELLINTFPVRTLRDLFVVISIIFAGGVVLLFRMIRPERLVNPEFLGSVGNYIASLTQNQSPYLPSTILYNLLINILKGNPMDIRTLIFYLYSGYFFYLLAKYSFRIFFFPGLSRAIEGKGGRTRERGGKLAYKIMAPFSPFSREMFLKDMKLFFRDASQWSQLLLLGFLIIIYLYNFSVLPLDKTPINSFYLKNIIGFANLILAGLVIAALGSRFVFPAVSLESRSLWLIKGSPVSSRKFIFSKLFFNLVPLLIVGFTITFFSCRFLNATPLITIVSTVTILLLIPSIATLGIFFGTHFPVLKYESVAQIATSYGGIIYMLTASLFVIAIVGIISHPTYLLFLITYGNYPVTSRVVLQIAGEYLAALTIVIISYILPIKKAIKRFATLEL